MSLTWFAYTIWHGKALLLMCLWIINQIMIVLDEPTWTKWNAFYAELAKAEWSSVAQCLPSMCSALGWSSILLKEKHRREGAEGG